MESTSSNRLCLHLLRLMFRTIMSRNILRLPKWPPLFHYCKPYPWPSFLRKTRGWFAPHPLSWYRCTVFRPPHRPASSSRFLSTPPGSRPCPSVTLCIAGSRSPAANVNILVLRWLSMPTVEVSTRCDVQQLSVQWLQWRI